MVVSGVALGADDDVVTPFVSWALVFSFLFSFLPFCINASIFFLIFYH